jgi:hypothetical protein
MQLLIMRVNLHKVFLLFIALGRATLPAVNLPPKNPQRGEVRMKRLGHIGTRRQLFRGMALGAAAVPFAFVKKSAAMGFYPPQREYNHDSGHDPQGSSSAVHCLLKGTRISTPSGYRSVQDLQIGDEVHTLAGVKAVRWVGRQKFTKEEGKVWHDSVMPVRIAPFALDDRSPHSDLYLSSLHCIFFNDALIPVKYLINGTSIARGVPSDTSTIEYYHIHLGTHEVLYAEGALAESFFDGGSDREHFSNFAEYERLYGAERQPEMTPFAPILGYRNRIEKIEGAARSLMSNIVDVRDRVQIAHDQLSKRAEALFV